MNAKRTEERPKVISFSGVVGKRRAIMRSYPLRPPPEPKYRPVDRVLVYFLLGTGFILGTAFGIGLSLLLRGSP